jgi:hypothetical protein
MSQALLVCADLVPALNNVYSLVSKNPMGLIRSFEIQFQNGLVILLSRSVVGRVVPIIDFIVLVVDMGGPAGRVHVGRVENDAIDRTVPIGELPTINAVPQVRGEQPIHTSGNPLPKHALPVSNISDGASRGYVQGNNVGENILVGALVSRENKLVG